MTEHMAGSPLSVLIRHDGEETAMRRDLHFAADG